MATRTQYQAAAQVIADAGGDLVGRTRLQKIVYLMQLAGFGNDFSFHYRHFGPYSDGLAQAMEVAVALGPVEEVETVAAWGGKYSIYRLTKEMPAGDQTRAHFVREAKEIDAVELELAATAAYLFKAEHVENPWEETRRRKPAKADNGRLEKAARAYEKLRQLAPRLPTLPSL